MSELRHDPLHGTWVILAPSRGRRPRDVRLRTEPAGAGPCPFCPGQEQETPPEVLATGRPAGVAADRPPWRVRVFPNRYPAVAGEAGRHEVVVLSPDHGRTLADLDPAAATEVLRAVQSRVAALAAEPGLEAVTFFLNSGAGAGASLSHPHGQLLATPVIPAVLQAELAALRSYRDRSGKCLVCALAARAGAEGRVVAADAHGTVLAPAASRFAWEMHVIPRAHRGRFPDASEAELAAVARHLVAACRALRRVADDPPYNLVLHTAPPTGDDFHWHWEIMPRLAPLAGFEAGTGFYINPVDPVAAARALRQAWDGEGAPTEP